MTFEQKLEQGKAGESVIAKWLIARGNSVMPVYEKIIDEGKGPQLFMANKQLVAPDLLVISNGKVVMIEAKHKTAFTWHRNSMTFTTGIDIRHYRHYIQVAYHTKLPVWIMFLHEYGQAKNSPPSPGGLFGNTIHKLMQNEHHRSDKYGTSGMVYWAREVDGGALKEIATYQQVTS